LIEGEAEMKAIKNLVSRFGISGELLVFLWQRKLWWLIPAVVVLILFSLLFVFAGSSVVAPFIYALF